jgi:general L-amino acid transport system substrate-binding protein
MPPYLLRTVLPACVGLLWSLGGTAQAAGSPTLDAIRARGNVVCAMQADNVPFSLPDSKGIWRGMDVDAAAPSRRLCSATRPRSLSGRSPG